MDTWNFILQNYDEAVFLTIEHLWIVGISLVIATITGVVIGLLSMYLTIRQIRKHGPES